MAARAGGRIRSYTLLIPLLEAAPHEQRTSAIVKGAGDLPVRADMYRRWWRQIGRAAGIPDGVWNMDTRAGGAIEADEAEAALEAIQAHSRTSGRHDAGLPAARPQQADRRGRGRQTQEREGAGP